LILQPAPGTPHAGWVAQTHQRGQGSDLPLLATCLALRNGETSAAIVDIDLIHLSPEMERVVVQHAAATTGVPADHIRVSCTHTHSGPNTFRLPVITDGLDMVLSYMESLPLRISGAIWQAFQNLRPVRLAAGAGSCDINVNRRFCGPDGRWVVGRNPQGPVDRTVRVVRFDGLDERPVATILHYACHPTIMAWENELVTPDYPVWRGGWWRRTRAAPACFCRERQETSDRGWALRVDLSIYRRLGTILGLEASRVALNLDTLPRCTRFAGYQESGSTDRAVSR